MTKFLPPIDRVQVFCIALLCSIPLIHSCGPNRAERDDLSQSSQQAPAADKEPADTKPKVEPPRIAVYLDFTGSMQGYYNAASAVDLLGKIPLWTQRNGGQVEFWKYGQQSEKSKGSTCQQIPAEQAKDLKACFAPSNFNWLANDYETAITHMTGLLKADPRKVAVLVTDGIPSRADGQGNSSTDHSIIQTNITSKLQTWSTQATSACSMVSYSLPFRGRFFLKQGGSKEINAFRPLYLVFLYHQSNSKYVKQLLAELGTGTADYHYNNTELGLYEFSRPLASNAKNGEGGSVTLTANQRPKGPSRNDFDSTKVKATCEGVSLSHLIWTKRPLPNNTRVELRAQVGKSEWEKMARKEVIIAYQAVSPAGLLLQGFDSDQNSPDYAQYVKNREAYEVPKTRDVNVLVNGIHTAFQDKPMGVARFKPQAR